MIEKSSFDEIWSDLVGDPFPSENHDNDLPEDTHQTKSDQDDIDTL